MSEVRKTLSIPPLSESHAFRTRHHEEAMGSVDHGVPPPSPQRASILYPDHLMVSPRARPMSPLSKPMSPRPRPMSPGSGSTFPESDEMSPSMKYHSNVIVAYEKKSGRMKGSFDKFVTAADRIADRVERLDYGDTSTTDNNEGDVHKQSIGENQPLQRKREESESESRSRHLSSDDGTSDKDSIQKSIDRAPIPVPDRIHILPGAFLSTPGSFLHYNYASSDQSFESRLQSEGIPGDVEDPASGSHSSEDQRPRYPYRATSLARIEEEREPTQQRKSRWAYVLFGFGFLGIALVSAGVAVAVQRDWRSNDSTTPNPDQPPCVVSEAALFNCDILDVELPTCAGNSYLLLQSTMMPTVYNDSLEEELSTRCSPVRLSLIQTAVALTNNPELNVRQYYLLTIFFLSTLGSAWSQRVGWLSPSTDPCSWIGISCTSANSPSRPMVVTRIELPKNDLIGSLPTEIGQFTSLRVLQVEGNSIRGQIPSEVGLFEGLRVLNLSHNPITRSIPTELGLLTELEILRLENTLLSGSIPGELGKARGLQDLRLKDINLLKGVVPKELGQLSNLEVLELTYTSFSKGPIPTEFASLSNLVVLNLTSTGLTGALPLSKLSRTLEKIDLSKNSIEETLPADIGTFRNLNRLVLESNRLTGTLPSELGLCESLVALNVASNQLEGTLPSELGQLGAIKTVMVQQNLLRGTVAPQICAWRNRSVVVNADFCPIADRPCLDAGCLV